MTSSKTGEERNQQSTISLSRRRQRQGIRPREAKSSLNSMKNSQSTVSEQDEWERSKLITEATTVVAHNIMEMNVIVFSGVN